MIEVQELKNVIKGEVKYDEETLEKYSRDASIFYITPQVVVFPKDSEDVKNLVKWTAEKRKKGEKVSLTPRSAGTDMGGGPLTESIVVEFTKHFNHIKEIGSDYAVVEPGVFYRDFEKETLSHNLLLPSYPASKSLAALGGMIANNAGGEKTLRYGKTNEYIDSLKVILRDGNEYTLRKLSKDELDKKMSQTDFEGEIYQKMYDLIENNYDVIQKAKPDVAKNSAGYALWDVWDRKYFDLTQLLVGSQGTLGIITEARIRLIEPKEHTRLAVLFLKNWNQLPEAVNKILPLEPESLETFDDNTLKLAMKFFPAIASKIENQNIFSLAFQFIPEFFLGIKMLGFPKLIMMVQFAEDTEEEVEHKLQKLEGVLKDMPVYKRILHNKKEAEKYWVIRRESFNLLRQKVKGKRTAPFVDDFIVKPEKLPELFPKILEVLDKHKIHTTLAGHAGSGNFHIIPLMDLSKQSEIDKIQEVAEQIYDLVIEYGGSITAEHNDGLIRSPYLEKMFGEKVYNLFKETKIVFDPQNIFNPGKKVNADIEYAFKHIDRKKK